MQSTNRFKPSYELAGLFKKLKIFFSWFQQCYRVKLSEIYISQKALELASNVYGQEGRVKRAHIGYYLIDDGIKELYDVLQITHKKNTNKVGLYISVISIISIILAIILSGIVGAPLGRPKMLNVITLIIEFILIFIPITEAVIKIIQTILNLKFGLTWNQNVYSDNYLATKLQKPKMNFSKQFAIIT